MAAAELKTNKNKNVVGAEGFLENERDLDHYDPFLNRPQGANTSDLGTFLHLMKAATATGILFLPNAFRRTGYVMAIVCGLFVGVIYAHNCVVLVRCAQILCRRHRVPKLDFAETVEVSFLTGPERTRAHGKTFGVFTNIVICFIQYIAVVIYILYVASSFQQLFEFYVNITLDLRLYVILFYPICCLLVLVPNLRYLTPFSAIGTVFFVLGIAVSWIYFLDDFPDPTRLDRFTTVPSVPMYCSIFLYALHNITLLLPLENTMANPENMPRLVGIATIINTLIYIAFGFLGYNKYKESCDTVTKNLPLDDTLFQLVKIGIALSVLFSLGITYIVPVDIIWPLIMKKINLDPDHKMIFRLVGISIANINTNWQEPTQLLFIKNGFIFLIFLLIMIFGAIESIHTMIKEYGGVKQEGC
ncbi:hypothetical protein KPH14_001968 [Odynerus spinipes]|uniref:Amino acid transporter transmembrane domain-containing protein n=1 Tax=Odynerus spinipes TaxID=1348599 RepID=A0AAD9S078_9HYME|nr:hypothetical protein KPH14_001968 [Odynerus spinipes]